MFACLAVRGAADTLLRMAREWSPRVERHGDGAVVLDVNGVERLFGEPAVKYTRVVGHSGHAENDRVDELAVAAYQRYL